MSESRHYLTVNLLGQSKIKRTNNLLGNTTQTNPYVLIWTQLFLIDC